MDKLIPDVTCKSATGVRGCFLKGIDGIKYFRVYNDDHSFTDYNLYHSDLFVTIDNDCDAVFYTKSDGSTYLDHHPRTLGYANEVDDND